LLIAFPLLLLNRKDINVSGTQQVECLEKEQWIGVALFMIGLLYLISAINAFWGLIVFSSALSVLRYQGISNPFGGLLALAGLIALLSFFTGIVSIVAGILFASGAPKRTLAETTAISGLQRTNELYDKLQGAYIRIWGGDYGKQRLDEAIEKYIKEGFTREAAIRKVAQDEGYA